MAISAETLPPPPDRPAHLDDDVARGPDPRWWVTHDLPHWLVPERSAARWRTVGLVVVTETPEQQLFAPPRGRVDLSVTASTDPGCAGVVVRHLDQAPAYPLFLRVDLFERARPGSDYPKSATVHSVRGWAG